jgi:hypothetical protein
MDASRAVMTTRRRFGVALGGVFLGLVPLSCAASMPLLPAVSEQQERSLLFPLRFGWLSSAQTTATLPSAIALGGKTSGRVLLYFEFPELSEPRQLLRAELLLNASGAPGSAVDVELSRSEAARPRLAEWSDQPRALFPRSSARLAAEGSPERLDVTEIVRAHSKLKQPLRLLLRAEPNGDEPVLIATGTAGGAAPRLEAYWE